MPRPGAAVLLLLLLSQLPALAGPVTLLSKADPANPSGSAGGAVRVAGVSSDGRYTLFFSDAGNLLAGVDDVNGGDDLFLHDRVAGTITLITHTGLDPAATADNISLEAALSADGRYAVFSSLAADLVSGQVDDEDDFPDVFLWDRDLGSSVLVSHEAGFPLVATGGCWTRPGLSADGARLVFTSWAPSLVPGTTDDDFTTDAFLYDRAGGSTVLVSHTSASISTAAGDVSSAAISADGNWVAFGSSADNVVAGQSGTADNSVFLYDRALGTNTLVSHTAASAVTTASGYAALGAISADGSRIAYLSDAGNLVSGQTDSNDDFDIFLYDRATNGSVLVSHASGSSTAAGNSYSEEASLSADGRYVAFSSYSSNLVAGDFNFRLDVFLYDRNTGANVLVSRSSSSPGTPANGNSRAPRIAADGSSVAFLSDGTNLVAGQVDAGLTDDVFLWTRSSGSTALVTHASGSPAVSGRGSSDNSFRISDDGAWIALASRSETLDPDVEDLNGLPDLFLYQSAGGNLSLATVRGGAASDAAGGSIAYWTGSSMSHDGRYIAFSSDAPNVIPGATDGNNGSDVFLHDRLTGKTVLVSHSSASPATAADASSRQPLVSAGGSVVLFESAASNLVPGQTAGADRQLYLWDRNLDQTTLVTHTSASPSTPGNGGIWGLGYYDVSGDGRWIVFNDYASNLIAGQTEGNGVGDVFLYDRVTGTTRLVSHASTSPVQTANSFTSSLAISDDGRYVAFHSQASDLVPGQPGPAVFLYDRIAGTTVRASPSGDWWNVAISSDGQRIVFTSSAANLVPGQVDTNGSQDVFVWERATGATRLVSHVPGLATTAGDGLSNFGTNSVGPPLISADGRWIAFYSNALNLVTGQTGGTGNIFLFDAASGAVTLVSRSVVSPTQTGNQSSTEPALSADGRFVAFLSQALDLVPGQIESNWTDDVFLYDREAGTVALVSHIPASEVTAGTPPFFSFSLATPRLSADGAWVAFQSLATDLAAGDRDGTDDAFLYANPLPGRDFFTVQPCRVLDTRQQTPALTSGTARTASVAGSCGIPATARAVAANVTVLQATSSGRLTLHPGDLAAPVTSTINFSAGITRANSAMLQLALDGTGTLSLTAVVNGGGTVDAIVDVSGYFE